MIKACSEFHLSLGIIATGHHLANEEISAIARALFEMVAWMGMHRHRDQQPPSVSDDVARRAVIEIAVRAVQRRNAPGNDTAI